MVNLTTHICVSRPQWVNQTLGNKLQWNLNKDLYISIQENVFGNVVRKLEAILSHPQCDKAAVSHLYMAVWYMCVSKKISRLASEVNMQSWFVYIYATVFYVRMSNMINFIELGNITKMMDISVNLNEKKICKLKNEITANIWNAMSTEKLIIVQETFTC